MQSPARDAGAAFVPRPKNTQNISGMPMQSHYELYTIAAHCAIGYQRHIFWGCTQESTQMHTVRIKLSLIREEMRFMKKYIDNVKPE